MNSLSSFNKTFGRQSLSVILGTILLFIAVVAVVAPSQTSETERKGLFQQLAQRWILTGVDQYGKGDFEQAEKSLLRAKEYEEYLTVDERNQLSGVLEKTRIAKVERKRVIEAYQQVAELIKQGKLVQAKAQLEQLKDNQSLRKEEKENIAEAIEKIDSQINAKAQSQNAEDKLLLSKEEPNKTKEGPEETISAKKDQQREIADLYYRSIGLYRTGQLERAREGFVKVMDSGLIPESMVKTIKGYVDKIDESLASKDKKISTPKAPILPKPTQPRYIVPGATTSLKVAKPKYVEPVTSQGPYIEVVNRRRDIIRSHTSAVVNDAAAKAQSYTSQNKFDKAKEVIASAELIVNQNQMQLGDELFKQHSTVLKQLSEKIEQAEKEKTIASEEEKHKTAMEAQRNFREQMENDKQERIETLMENALAYKKQQKYEAALGQVEQLLTIEPQNDEALSLKDELEDSIYFRKQSEVKKEADKQKADTLLKADEALIPYADELRYPKDWREIVQKPTRQPDKPLGVEPTDAAVYERLAQIVDLSQLTPTMPFRDAIEIIKNSVEPPLTIFVNWGDLGQNADIDQSTPINMDPMSGVRLDTALKRLLSAVSSVELGYTVDGGVVTIATATSLPTKLVPRIYDVTDLLGQPANFIQLPSYGYGDYSRGPMTSGTGGTGGTSGGGGGGYGGGGGGGGMGGGMGGMGGGMGGMGGGMGGMGGGMGGMGGGMGGMGGGMGGMGGMGMGGMGGGIRARDLAMLIEQTVGKPEDWAPDDWSGFTYGTGNGTVTPYPQDQPKKFAILQTIEIHREIEKVLTEMRKALGYQVSIEARFLVVSENFLEDIGMDVDLQLGGGGSLGKWGILTFTQNSAASTAADLTKVPGSLGGLQSAINVEGGYGVSLDPLMVHFLLRAVQGHSDARTLTAPKVTVLSGESATFWVSNDVSYALPPNTQTGTSAGAFAGGGVQTSSVQQNIGYIQVGTLLNITPTITPDKKNVLLNIITELQDLLRMKTHTIEGPVGTTGEVVRYDVTVPETETSQVMTRVSVPDGGTLLLGGQKISAEENKEVGVPVLSKIPIIGRAFRNNSEIRDQKILLILVKPTIILQDEREAEAVAALNGGM